MYWKVRTGEGSRASIDYLTASEIQTRGLIAQILDGSLSEGNAYVQTGSGKYQSLNDWRRDHR